MSRVLVVGSVALDSVETPYGSQEEILGGSATYASVSASFFTPVNLVGVVGTDFPKAYLNLLKKRNIDLEGLEVRKGETFRWKGRYGYDLNVAFTLVTELNVFEQFNPRLPEKYCGLSHVFLANIDPDLQLSVLKQLNHPQFVALDSMGFWIEKKKRSLLQLLKKVDLALLNDQEARMLTGNTNLAKAGKELIRLGPQMVLIKKGEHGVLFFTKDFVFSTPAYLLETIKDPTGAGDTFAGGFMGYLAKGKKQDVASIRKAIIYGSVMASFSVEDFGLNRLLTLKSSDIQKRFNEFKLFTRF
ncbi:MAG: bifunctional hydroxymethylpyrimidine kinase/phosphomethylpyrimidine kinase [Candidatus Omnitrophica bacterium]|nr:bifunctional hydroxymethylpyrimidine kinase/phosphomethylpyrimidine kinase [Candidatus Omnitrophota bacterium]